MTHSSEKGFTAVELLVTLFVAAAFIVAGYQLYSFVIRDAGQARTVAQVNNIAYDYLREYENLATEPCRVQTPLNNQAITIEGLVDVAATVTITCPIVGTNAISKIAVTITYNNPQQQVQYATYVNAALTLPSGIVGWWRLNGTARDVISGDLGTVSGTTLTTGQNGAANGAYRFDGVNDYIELAPAITDFDSFTVSTWVRGVGGASAADGMGYIVHRSINTSVGSSVYWLADGISGYYEGNVSGYNAPAQPTTTIANTTTWRLLTMTYDGTTRRMYVDGQLQSSEARTFTNTTTGTRLTLGSAAAGSTYRPIQGDIDDVRLYNRALPQSEIETLYNQGAQ